MCVRNRLRPQTAALPQAAIKCFGKQLKLQNVQNFAHPPVPVADAPAWEAAAAAPSAAHVLQFGPQPSALCLPGKKGSPIKQTVKPGLGQTCCSSGADCELKAGDYTFLDTTCAVLTSWPSFSCVPFIAAVSLLDVASLACGACCDPVCLRSYKD